MAASYRSFGTYPNERTEITGTLAEIQAINGPEGVFGIQSDLPGVEMRYQGGAWAYNGDARVSVIPATGVPGVAYRLSQYPGSSLQWDSSQSKYSGTLGSGFANLTAIQAVPGGITDLLALGTETRDVTGAQYRRESWGWNRINEDQNDLWDFIGDSITASGGGWDGVTHQEKYGGRYSPGASPQASMAFLSSGRIKFCRNWGFGGEGCADMITRFPLISTSPAKNRIIQIGTNNFGSGTAALADFETFLQMLIPISNNIVVFAIPPNSSTIPAAWNLAQELICRKYGIPFISPYSVITNRTTGRIAAGKSADGTHPYPFATMAVAKKALMQFPDAFLAPKPGTYVGQENKFANGFFTVDTNSDGTADGWTIGRAVGTLAEPADKNIQGMTQTITPSAGYADAYARVPMSALTIGVEYVVRFHAIIANDYRNLLTIVIQDGTGGSGAIISYSSMSGGASAADNVAESGVYCFRFVAASTTAELCIYWHDAAMAGLVGSPVAISELVCLPA